jgi:hypothetical protein
VSARWLLMLALAPGLPGSALAASLATSGSAVDTLLLDAAFPPELVADPLDAEVAYVARSQADTFPGVFPVRVEAGQPLAFTGFAYVLPTEQLDCSHAAPFATPFISGLSFDVVEAGLRGWLTTTGCELVVPFDPIGGLDWPLLFEDQPRLSVPTTTSITGSYETYADTGGQPVSGFQTGFTSDVLRVGDRLLVSTSNFLRVGSQPELYPGTVLLFDIDDAGAMTTVSIAAPAFIVTSDPNPTSLTELPGGVVAVTNTGLLDPGFPPLVTGQGSIDLIDPAAGGLIGSIPLGETNPGGRGLGLDPSGSVAVAPSHVYRELYAVDVRGLDQLPVAAIDPTHQRVSCNDVPDGSASGLPCLRARVIRGAADPIVIPSPAGGGPFGFMPAVAFAPSGTYVASTSFNDDALALAAFDPRNLDSPHPLLPSRFGPGESHEIAPLAGGFGTECCPGGVLLGEQGVAGLDGDAVLWTTGAPDGLLMRGFLSGVLPPAAEADVDGDGTEDSVDVCPLAFDAQLDQGGVGLGAPPDGIGDACQCGDVDDDGRVLAPDVAALRGWLSGSAPALGAPQKCQVAGEPACDLIDATVLRRALAGRGPGVSNDCSSFLPQGS